MPAPSASESRRSGATCIRIASTAELVAVGLHTGEVAVYRLWPAKADAEPLHVIGLGEWGYEPEVTGSVADLHWSPDERVLAVRPLQVCMYACGEWCLQSSRCV